MANQKTTEFILNKWNITDLTKSNIPEYLNTEAKLKFLEKFPNNNLTLEQTIEFLRYQTTGEDWQNFDILIDYYDLKFDKNGMIVFTEEFPFDSRIKKEALFIWWLLKIVNQNALVSRYNQYLTFDLQSKLEESIISATVNMKIDICFSFKNVHRS